MEAIDKTEVGLYLRAVAFHARRRRKKGEGKSAIGSGKGGAIELRRGTIDEIFG